MLTNDLKNLIVRVAAIKGVKFLKKHFSAIGVEKASQMNDSQIKSFITMAHYYIGYKPQRIIPPMQY